MTYRVVYVDHVARLSGGEIALVRALTALGSRVDAHVILGEHGPLVDRLREVGASVEVLPMPVGGPRGEKGQCRAGHARTQGGGAIAALRLDVAAASP